MSYEQATHSEVVEATRLTEASMQPQRVPVNVYEATEALVVVAPMPAIPGEDVTVELSRGCLRFWAGLRSAAPRDYLVHEWDYGGYEREIDLPDGFGRAIEATLARGQLVIRVLRGEPAATVTVTPSGA